MLNPPIPIHITADRKYCAFISYVYYIYLLSTATKKVSNPMNNTFCKQQTMSGGKPIFVILSSVHVFIYFVLIQFAVNKKIGEKK